MTHSQDRVVISHNPNSGTSRNTLALIRNSGVEPEVILHLQTPPSRETLLVLLSAMGIPPRELLRRKVAQTPARRIHQRRRCQAHQCERSTC